MRFILEIPKVSNSIVKKAMSGTVRVIYMVGIAGVSSCYRIYKRCIEHFRMCCAIRTMTFYEPKNGRDSVLFLVWCLSSLRHQ